MLMPLDKSINENSNIFLQNNYKHKFQMNN